MFEVRKCPKHSGSESLPLLRHIVEILWSRSRFPEISKFLNLGDGYVSADKPELAHFIVEKRILMGLVFLMNGHAFFIGDSNDNETTLTTSNIILLQNHWAKLNQEKEKPPRVIVQAAGPHFSRGQFQLNIT